MCVDGQFLSLNNVSCDTACKYSVPYHLLLVSLTSTALTSLTHKIGSHHLNPSHTQESLQVDMFQVKPARVNTGESLQVDMFQVKPARVSA